MNKIPQPVEVDETQIPRDDSVTFEEVISDSFEYNGTEVQISVSGEEHDMIVVGYEDDLETAMSIGVIWAYQYGFPGINSSIRGSTTVKRTRVYRLARCYYEQRDFEMLESDKNG